MVCRVALVRTDVSKECSASIIRGTRIDELGTTLAVLSSSETSVLTRATRCNIPQDGFLHGHRRENLKSYISLKLSHRTEVRTYYDKIRVCLRNVAVE
jgi:hypothetical protein